jgi:hypothetical protein
VTREKVQDMSHLGSMYSVDMEQLLRRCLGYLVLSAKRRPLEPIMKLTLHDCCWDRDVCFHSERFRTLRKSILGNHSYSGQYGAQIIR